jgi:hypothetical protein
MINPLNITSGLETDGRRYYMGLKNGHIMQLSAVTGGPNLLSNVNRDYHYNELTPIQYAILSAAKGDIMTLEDETRKIKNILQEAKSK